MEYVAGFLFDEFFEHVVLVRKEKPAWQKDRLNGVGGKIESGETPEQAMRREFFEEAGMDVPNWREFCALSGDDWIVHFFYATGDVEAAKTMTEETIGFWNVDELPWDHSVIPNLHWLIPMATTIANGTESATKFTTQEVRTAAV